MQQTKKNNPSVISSLVFLATEPSKPVGDNNIQLRSSLDNGLPLLGGDVVSNLCAVSPVVHHQQLEVTRVVNNELLESIGEIVTGLLVGSVTHIGHQRDTFELSSDPRVNTLWPPPAFLKRKRRQGITMRWRESRTRVKLEHLWS